MAERIWGALPLSHLCLGFPTQQMEMAALPLGLSCKDQVGLTWP